jgi:hypothetical protein
MPAIPSAVGNAWLTLDQQNAGVGQAVTEAYPGPVTGDHAGGPEDVPGRSPAGGQEGVDPSLVDAAGGEISGGGGGYPMHDYSGHAGAVAPFDAGYRPFAGPGAAPDVHSFDTGGYARKTSVLMPRMFGWARKVLSSQTYDDQSYTYTPEGFKINTPNDRIALDQNQSQDADAYDPFLIGYSERPLFANLAYEVQPLTGALDSYTPSGQLMDMTPTGGQGNNVYSEPADPTVQQAPASAPAPAPSTAFDGMDF